MNINTYLKESIAKGVSRGTYKTFAALRKEIAALKRDQIQLRRTVKELGKKQAALAVQAPKTSDIDTSKFRRPSNGAAVRNVRAKLGLSQEQFAKLVKVSSGCIALWEKSTGLIKMRSNTLAEFGKARLMNKTSARAALGLK
jgi:DNA-binding transcriptional regulator YiaG